MAFPVTLNGTTYTLADFEGTNYVDGFPNALEDFVTQAGDIYNSTSTSSVAIGTGEKSFTTADSGKPYQEGTPLRIADAAAPETNFMDCIVTSYSGTSLVVESIGFGGSGTKSSWTINIGGAKTVDGTLAINQGGTGATTASAAASALGLGTEDSPEFTGLTVTSSGDFSGATISDLGTVTTADINGGTVDGVTINDSAIGGSTPAAGSFTTITGSGDMNIDSGTLFVDASENRVGVGTSSPADNIHLRAGTPTLRISDTDNNTTLDDEQVALELKGRYWSGGSDPDANDLSSARVVLLKGNNDGSGGSALSFETSNTGGSGLAEKMRITSGGNVLLNDTTEGDGRRAKLKIRNDVDYSSTEFEDNATLLVQNEENNHSAVIVFHSNDSGGSSKRSGIVGGNINSNTNALGFYGDIANKTTSSSPDVIIDSSGNVDLTNGGGNIIMASGAGIDFSATANSSGTMSNELLADYEEGTWTPTDVSGAGLTFTVTGEHYTKIGNVVTVSASVQWPSTADTASARIGGLPFISLTTTNSVFGGGPSWSTETTAQNLLIGNGTARIELYDNSATTVKNNTMSGKTVRFCIQYLV